MADTSSTNGGTGLSPEQRIAELESLNAKLESRLAKLMEKSQAKLSSLNEEKVALQQKIDVLLKTRVGGRRTPTSSVQSPPNEPAGAAATSEEVDKLKAKVAELERQVTEAAVARESAIQQVQELVESELKEKAEKQAQEAQEAQAEREQLEANHASEIASLKADHEVVLSAAAASAKAQVDQLKQEHGAALATQRQALESEKQSTATKLVEATEALAKVTAERDAERSQHVDRVKALEEQAMASDTRVKELQATVEEMDKAAKDLRAKLDEAEGANAASRKTAQEVASKAKDELSQLQDELKQAEQSRHALESQLDQLKTKHKDDLNQLTTKHTEELAALRQSLSATDDTTAHLHSHLTDVESKLAAELAAHKQTNADLASLQSAHADLQSTYAQVQAAHADLTAAHADVTSQLDAVQRNVEALKAAADAAETKAKQVQADMQAKLDQVTCDVTKCVEKEWQAKLEAQAAQHTLAIAQLESTLESRTTDAERAWQAKLDAALEQHKQAVAQLEAECDEQLKKAQDDRDAQVAAAEAAKKEKVAAAKRDADEARKALEDKEKAWAAERKQLEQAIDTAKRDTEADVGKRLAVEHAATLDRLRAEAREQAATADKALVDVKKQLAAAQADGKAKASAVADLEGKLVAHDAEHAKAAKEWRRKEEEHLEKLRIMDVQVRALAEESQELVTLRKRVTEVQAELDAARKEASECEAANKQLADERAANASLRKALDKADDSVRELEVALQAAQARADEAQGAIEQLPLVKSELATVQALFHAKSNEYESMRQRAVAAETARDNARLDWERQLADAIKDAQVARAKHEADVERLASQAADWDTVTSEWQAKLEAAQQVAESKSAEVDTVRADLESVRAQLDTVETRLIEMADEADALRDKLAKEQGSAARVQELTQLNQRLAQDLEALSTRESHLKQVNRSLKDEVRKLSRQGSASSLSLSGAAPANGASSPPSMSASAASLPGVVQSSLTRSLTPTSPGGFSSAAAAGPAALAHDPAFKPVNLVYLRSVLLSFLEKKAMRPQLVPVLNTLLDGTEEDMKRLQMVMNATP